MLLLLYVGPAEYRAMVARSDTTVDEYIDNLGNSGNLNRVFLIKFIKDILELFVNTTH